MIRRAPPRYRWARDPIAIFLDPTPMVVGGTGANQDLVLRSLSFGGRMRGDELEGFGRMRRGLASIGIWPSCHGSRLVHVLVVDITWG